MNGLRMAIEGALVARGRRTVAHGVSGCAVVASRGDPCDCRGVNMACVHSDLWWVLASERWCLLRETDKLRAMLDRWALTDKSRI